MKSNTLWVQLGLIAVSGFVAWNVFQPLKDPTSEQIIALATAATAYITGVSLALVTLRTARDSGRGTPPTPPTEESKP